MKTPMHDFVDWLNSLSDTDPARLRAVQASITYDSKIERFRVYVGPRSPVLLTDLEGVKRALTERG